MMDDDWVRNLQPGEGVLVCAGGWDQSLHVGRVVSVSTTPEFWVIVAWDGQTRPFNEDGQTSQAGFDAEYLMEFDPELSMGEER